MTEETNLVNGIFELSDEVIEIVDGGAMSLMSHALEVEKSNDGDGRALICCSGK